jgi:peptide/nickel transport system substrate-binding protein
MEMYAYSMTQADPAIWLQMYVSWEVATKANKWQGRNVVRWRNADYDAAYNAAQTELDPVKRAALLIKANDIAVSGNVLPLIHRAEVSAVGTKLTAPRSGWDNDLSFLPDWYREA